MTKKRTFILCDSTKVNSHGFRIDLSGMDLNRFESNPVMLYQHNSDELIGRWENLRVEDKKLLAEAVFDTEDEIGKKVSGKVERGFLKGCSIGIMINKLTETTQEAVADKTELIEASMVAIPADAGAVVLYDQNRKILTFNEVKMQLNFNNKPTTKKMDEKEKQSFEQSIAEKDKKIAELEAQISKQKEDATKAYLDNAVKDGKITEPEKEHYAKLAMTDFDTVQKIIENKEVKASASLKDMQAQATATAPAGRENWNYLEWMKKDPNGLKELKANNPKEFERLQKTLQNG